VSLRLDKNIVTVSILRVFEQDIKYYRKLPSTLIEISLDLGCFLRSCRKQHNTSEEHEIQGQNLKTRPSKTGIVRLIKYIMKLVFILE